MTFSIERFKTTSGPVDVDDIDFDKFAAEPLSAAGLRCVRYMHDIEYHTIRYLTDLLNSPASRDSDVSTFLTLWNHEEFWHGEALAKILRSHGHPGGLDVEIARRRSGYVTDMVKSIPQRVFAATSPNFEAIYFTWGAVNEWTAQAAYGLLAKKENHSELTVLLRRMMKQEGSHAGFYAHFARQRLEHRSLAQRATRLALNHLWAPVGTGVAEPSEVDFVNQYLFGGPEGRIAAQRIDTRIDRLPGLAGLGIIEAAISQQPRTAVSTSTLLAGAPRLSSVAS